MQSTVSPLRQYSKKSGLYQITMGAREYVGSASDLYGRRQVHANQLRTGKHHNIYMQRTWDKEGGFSFDVLMLCDKKDLRFYEQRYLDAHKPSMNLSTNAYAPVHTDAGRKSISEKATARFRTVPFAGRLWAPIELAAHLGVNLRTLRGRIKTGTQLDAPIHRPTYELGGEQFTAAQLARKAGVRNATMLHRLQKMQMTAEAAVNTPLMGRGGAKNKRSTARTRG